MIPITVQCSAQALPQMAAEGRCDLALGVTKGLGSGLMLGIWLKVRA